MSDSSSDTEVGPESKAASDSPPDTEVAVPENETAGDSLSSSRSEAVDAKNNDDDNGSPEVPPFKAEDVPENRSVYSTSSESEASDSEPDDYERYWSDSTEGYNYGKEASWHTI